MDGATPPRRHSTRGHPGRVRPPLRRPQALSQTNVKKIIFTVPARADVRRIDRDSAMRILVKKVQGDSGELRLRIGDYRVRFTEEPQETLVIHSIRHRSDAYR